MQHAATSKPYPPWVKTVKRNLKAEFDAEQPPKRSFTWPTIATKQSTSVEPSQAQCAQEPVYNPAQDLKLSRLTKPMKPYPTSISNVIKSVNVTENLIFSLESGPYGKFYRLQRGNQWFTVSRPQWRRIVDNKEAIRKIGNELTLTSWKEIRTQMFDQPFIALHHTYRRDDGGIFDSCFFITLKEFDMVLHEASNSGKWDMDVCY